MSQVWDHNCSSHTQKLVLLALADNANDEGSCWPSIATISQKCQLSERCVYEQVGRLVKSHLLSIKSGGGNRSNVYQLHLRKQTPERHAGVNAMQGTPEQDAPLPLNVVQGTPERHAGEPSYNHQEEPSSNPKTVRVSVSRRPISVEEVIEKGKFIGLDEQSCRDWFRDCEACGWTRGDGSPFDNWPRQLVIHREHVAEKRIKGNGQASGRPATIMDLKSIVSVKEEKAKALWDKYAFESGLSVDWSDQAKHKEWSALRTEIKGLKERIERMA